MFVCELFKTGSRTVLVVVEVMNASGITRGLLVRRTPFLLFPHLWKGRRRFCAWKCKGSWVPFQELQEILKVVIDSAVSRLNITFTCVKYVILLLHNIGIAVTSQFAIDVEPHAVFPDWCMVGQRPGHPCGMRVGGSDGL